jgi:hypothetical protein
MPFTRTFEGLRPPRRYDGQAFTQAQIREAATRSGTYTTIQTIVLFPLDVNPASPQVRNLTTTQATQVDGWYVIRWVDAGTATTDSDPIYYTAGIGLSAGAAYASVTDLQEVVEDVDSQTAGRLLEDASDWIDAQLGAREIDPATGRKVIEDEVEPWQWAKLTRATLKVAAKLYADPSLLTPQQFDTVKGPDFETTGPRGGSGLFGSEVSSLLTDSYLPVLSGRAR